MISEEKFARRLDEIQASQDRIKAEFPKNYWQKQIWKRLDWEAQAICRAVGW